MGQGKYHSSIKRTMMGLIVLSVALHFVSYWLGTTYLADARWPHERVHSVLEILGAFIAFFVAYLLITLQRIKGGTSFNIQIASALICMGVFDLAHAVVEPGLLFVWLHSLATFLGGVFFITVYMPSRWFERFGDLWPVYAAIFSLAVVGYLFAMEDSLPVMITNENFSSLAVTLNVSGGFLLILASVRLLFSYYQTNKLDDLLFVLHSFMFGLAAVMFEQSYLWDMTWWSWHGLRFVAYLIALYFAVSNVSYLVGKLKLEKDYYELSSRSQKKELNVLSGVLQKLQIREGAIIQNLKDALIMIDKKGLISMFSKSAEYMFGCKEENVIGKNIAILMTDEFAINHDGYMKKYKKGAQSKVIGKNRELMAKRKDGSLFPIDLTITELQDKGEVFFVGLVRDITDKKSTEKILIEALESAEQANQSKSDFLANVSHELRTPLNSIYGTLQLLERMDQGDKLNGLVGNSIYSIKNLLVIINDILDFSKIESGKLELNHINFKIHNLLRSLEFEYSNIAHSKGIEFNVYSDVNDELMVFGDPVRINQIMVNLLGNAIKFTEKGHITCSLEFHKKDNEDGILISVQDSGVGIKSAVLDDLFNRFEQADNTITREYGGTGLGLAITQSLVELMGGMIEVDSEWGVGSEFRVWLPVKRVELDEPQTQSTKIDNTDPPDLRHKTLLIVEDNEINVEILQAILDITNANIVVANDGEEGVEAFTQHNPDLVLMDIQMPKLDGMSACKKIKVLNSNTPIIALTANVMSNDIEQYKSIGFDEHIAKPIEVKHLYTVLNRFF